MYKKMDMDLMKLMEDFDTEEECRDRLKMLRWPDGVKCPRCQGEKQAYDSRRYAWDCYSCGYQFSVLTGTIFHDTHLPLPKWFLAIYIMVESKKGVSANQMKRMLRVSSKTAWYLCHRIRAAMHEANPAPLAGTVEVDETWIGGKEHGKQGSRRNKTIVAGAIQRGGDIRLEVVSDVTRQTLHGFIRTHVHPATQRIITDSWTAYKGIADADTTHETVDHNIKEYVRGDVHTNTVENAWSLFKRGVVGSYHKLSEKHLDAYLDEFEWRFNNRENQYLFRDTLRKLISSENLPYQMLIN